MNGNFLILSALCLLASCSSIQHKRENYVKTCALLTEQQKKAILDGEVIDGMSQEMVLASWGKPLDVTRELVRDDEIVTLLYQRTVDAVVTTYRVRLRNGLVREVKLIDIREKVYSPYNKHYYWRHYPEFP